MPTVLFEIKDGTAFVTLIREEKMNAFIREMAIELKHVLDQCRDDEKVRAIYISGKGKAFSAGQDLAEVDDPHGPGRAKILS